MEEFVLKGFNLEGFVLKGFKLMGTLLSAHKSSISHLLGLLIVKTYNFKGNFHFLLDWKEKKPWHHFWWEMWKWKSIKFPISFTALSPQLSFVRFFVWFACPNLLGLKTHTILKRQIFVLKFKFDNILFWPFWNLLHTLLDLFGSFWTFMDHCGPLWTF